MSLLRNAQTMQDRSRQSFGQLADVEQQRNNMNRQIKQQETQGRVSATASGAAMGFQLSGGNPYGALIGAGVGLASDILF